MKKYYSCAFRGRGEGWKHQLEIRNDELSNCITQVTKDFYVLEKIKTDRFGIYGKRNGETSVKFDMGCNENKSSNHDIG